MSDDEKALEAELLALDVARWGGGDIEELLAMVGSQLCLATPAVRLVAWRGWLRRAARIQRQPDKARAA